MIKKTATETSLSYRKIVESYAHFFDRPEVRLRFLQNTLAQQSQREQQLENALRRFSFIKNSALYQRLLEIGFYTLILAELRRLLPLSPRERRRLLIWNRAPFAARLFYCIYQGRYAFGVLAFASIVAGLIGIYSLGLRATHYVNDYLTHRYQTKSNTASSPVGINTVYAAATSTKYLPDYRPEKIWLVERKTNYERYSNGGRILTDYETDNHPRGYYPLPRRAEGSATTVRRAPIGIVFHTSESDMLPFTPDNNDSIETRTQGLLGYIRKNRSYNYMIDRFGQIYRIVQDDHAANHAGNSIWADKENVYVGLNESFLGVCFETRSDAGAVDEQLTEAQIISGRLLTAILRSRYNIDDTNCVTHGLVSVNPDKMLIGFHHDWVHGFPFDAMGLSDKYQVAPASISEFGCTYDDETLQKMGGVLWPGVKVAEEEFNQRVAQAQLQPEELRRRLRDRYREQMNLAHRLRLSSPAGVEQASANHDEASVRSQPERSDTGK